MTKHKIFCPADMVITIAPLTVGLGIYLLMRPKSVLLRQLADAAGMSDLIIATKRLAAPVFLESSGFLIYSAPDGIWSFAFTYALSSIWRGSGSRIAMMSASFLPCFLGVLSELMQSWGLLSGVYDPADLYAYVLGALLALMIFYARSKLYA